MEYCCEAQPPNSPDMNILDLGMFSSMQSLQHQEHPNNIDELVSAVDKAFIGTKKKTINKTFLSLQQCMKVSLTLFGDNNYTPPHMGNDHLMTEGTLPDSIRCEP